MSGAVSPATRATANTAPVITPARAAGKTMSMIAVGKSAGAERIQVAALLELLVEDYRRRDCADLHEAEQRVNRLLKPNFGHLRASAFTTKTVNRYIELGKAWVGRTRLSIASLPSSAVRFGSVMSTIPNWFSGFL